MFSPLAPREASANPFARESVRWATLVLMLALMAGSFIWQTLQLQRITEVPRAAPRLLPVAQVPKLSVLGGLFGREAPRASLPTTFRVRLLASFVHPDPRRSSALIEIDGRPAQRLTLGTELAPEARLLAIEPQQVRLSFHGREFTLRLQRSGQPVLLQSGSALSSAF